MLPCGVSPAAHKGGHVNTRTYIPINVNKANTVNVPFVLASEDNAYVLPPPSMVLNLTILPAFDVSVIVNQTVIQPTVTINVTKSHMRLRAVAK
jgi:hypothetical protein